MNKIYLLLAVFLLVTNIATAQKKKYDAKNTMTVAFYNIENLFDTIDSPNVKDEEFTPQSPKKWNTERYNKKLIDLAFVLKQTNPEEYPEIIGLAEVENKRVVEDLINKTSLKYGNYGIIHRDSKDSRGIDVAFIYRKQEFKVLSDRGIKVIDEDNPDNELRDILYIKGLVSKTDTFHVFVNHWKSRNGGQEKTEPKRIGAAKILRATLDSILTKNKNANIVIIGDFNDEPENKSINEVLFATNNKTNPTDLELYNLMYDKSVKDLGTNYYKGKAFMLDNLIISKKLATSTTGWHESEDGGNMFISKFNMYKNEKTGEESPNRTYGGDNYYGGVSDHYPVYFKLVK